MNMKMKGFYKLFAATFKEYIRDKGAVFWGIFLPVILTITIGSIYSGKGQDINTFYFILPGILAMTLFQMGLFGSLNFLSLREQKIIRGLYITPLSPITLLISNILLRLSIALLQCLLIFSIAYIFYGFRINGNILILIFAVIMGSLTFSSLGFMIITFIKTAEAGQSILPVIQLPVIFLSGIFFRIESIPLLFKPLVKAIPLTYLTDILRNTTSGIETAHPLTVNFLVLTIWLVLTLLVTTKNWKWE